MPGAERTCTDPGGLRAPVASPIGGCGDPAATVRSGVRRTNPAIGWVASAVLLTTLVRQVLKQARSDAAGVWTWLFAGQSAASIGLMVYSVMGTWVSILANSRTLPPPWRARGCTIAGAGRSRRAHEPASADGCVRKARGRIDNGEQTVVVRAGCFHGDRMQR